MDGRRWPLRVGFIAMALLLPHRTGRAVGIGQTTTEQGGLRVSWMSESGMSRDSIFTVALAVGSGINVNTYKRAQKRRFFQENVRRFVKKSALLGSLIGVKCHRL